MQEKYADILHLPLTLERWSRLTVAFTKYEHRKQMQTAWPTKPKSL